MRFWICRSPRFRYRSAPAHSVLYQRDASRKGFVQRALRLGAGVIVKNRLRAAGRRILGSALDTMGQIVQRDARCHTFFRAIEFINFERVPGDIVECGVFGGLSLALLAKGATFDSKGMTRRIVGIDSFDGLPLRHRGTSAMARRRLLDRAWLAPADAGRRRRDGGQCTDALRAPVRLTRHSCTRADLPRCFRASSRLCILRSRFFMSIVICTSPPRRSLTGVAPALQDGTMILFDDWFHYRGNPNRGEARAFREFIVRASRMGTGALDQLRHVLQRLHLESSMIVAHVGPPAARQGGPAGYLAQLAARHSMTYGSGHTTFACRRGRHRQRHAPLPRLRRGRLATRATIAPNVSRAAAILSAGDRAAADGWRTGARDCSTAWEGAQRGSAAALAGRRRRKCRHAVRARHPRCRSRARRRGRQGSRSGCSSTVPMPIALYIVWCWGVPERPGRRSRSFPTCRRGCRASSASLDARRSYRAAMPRGRQ